MTAMPGSLALLTRETRGPVISPDKAAVSRRVILLIAAIVLMGLADLACTLAYMQTVGLPEANPIARWLARFGDTRAIVGFKLLTMLLSCYCLYIGRTERRMEWCAWTCTAILLGLSIHWISFNRSIAEHTNLIAYLSDPEPCPRIVGANGKAMEMWVRLEE
jgi:hypothetical protein